MANKPSNKRSIFQEVSDDAPDQPAQIGVIDRGPTAKGARGFIKGWLITLFALVFAMIVVGGLTRLTDSGLSITEWRPVTGAIPPMSELEWQGEFDKYQQIDQWKIENQWMQLSDFKSIYWWEWGHRQLGRVIGLVWALGFFGLLITRKIPAGWNMRLLGIGILGGAQGAIGWWMVASGVTQGQGMTSVASYRLAVHLGLAFAILGFITWYIFLIGRSERDLMQARRAGERRLIGLSTGLMHLVFLQVLIGALVAGIDAGRTYTDWPLMGGQIFPPNPGMFEPIWRNLFENPGVVQFIHRVVGYLVVGFGVVVWLKGRISAHPLTQSAFYMMIGAVAVQLVLGIFTVLYGAPTQLAIAHQIMAVALFVLTLRARFLSAYPIVTSIKGAAK